MRYGKEKPPRGLWIVCQYMAVRFDKATRVLKTWSTDSSTAAKGLADKRLPPHDRRFLAHAALQGFVVANAGYARLGAFTSAFLCAPARPPVGRVVMAHATGNDALYPHGALVLALLAAGFEVFLFDLDGHGRYSTTRLDPHLIRGAVRAAIDHYRSVSKADPSTRIHLVGQSLGGALALAAVADSVAVASLTLISAPLTLDLSPQALAAELRTLGRAAYWSLFSTYGVAGLIPAMGPLRRAAYPLRLTDSSRAYPRFVADLVAELDAAGRAARIAVPTLLVYGSRDLLVPAAQGSSLKELIPQAELHVSPGATHFTTPLEPDAIKRVIAFLSKH